MKKLILLIVFLSGMAMSASAQNTQHINPREVAAKLYQQCMAVADKNFATQQKTYCECTAEKVATQVSGKEMATIVSSAGQGASREDIGKIVMQDPRFIQIVSHCFSVAINPQSGHSAAPVGSNLAPSTSSGLVGKPFSSGQ